MNLSIQQIVPEDIALMKALLATFGEAFDEVETYGNPPSADYLRQLLLSHHVKISCTNLIWNKLLALLSN